MYSLFTLCQVFCHTISFSWKVLSHGTLLSHQVTRSVLTNVTSSSDITRKGPISFTACLHRSDRADPSPVSMVSSTSGALLLPEVVLSIAFAAEPCWVCTNKLAVPLHHACLHSRECSGPLLPHLLYKIHNISCWRCWGVSEDFHSLRDITQGEIFFICWLCFLSTHPLVWHIIALLISLKMPVSELRTWCGIPLLRCWHLQHR